MTINKSPKEYDEDDAMRFIRNYLPLDMKDKLTEDDITYIVDIVYDYYDEKGLFDESLSDNALVDIDEEEMVSYVLKSVRKDKVKPFSAEEITSVIQGELAYCESIGIFE